MHVGHTKLRPTCRRLEHEPQPERATRGGAARGGSKPAADCGTFDPWSKVAISKNNTNKAATTTNRHTHTQRETHAVAENGRHALTP